MHSPIKKPLPIIPTLRNRNSANLSIDTHHPPHSFPDSVWVEDALYTHPAESMDYADRYTPPVIYNTQNMLLTQAHCYTGNIYYNTDLAMNCHSPVQDRPYNYPMYYCNYWPHDNAPYDMPLQNRIPTPTQKLNTDEPTSEWRHSHRRHNERHRDPSAHLEKPFEPPLHEIRRYTLSAQLDTIQLQELDSNRDYITASTPNSSVSSSSDSMLPRSKKQNMDTVQSHSTPPSRIPSPWGTSKSDHLSSPRPPLPTYSSGSSRSVCAQTPVHVPDEISETSLDRNIFEYHQKELFPMIDCDLSDIEPAPYEDGRDRYPLSIASSSLVNIRSNTKLYRRMAQKTHSKDIQMTYAKYLLQISKLYEPHDTYHTDTPCLKHPAPKRSKSTIVYINSDKYDIEDTHEQESPSEIRHRLLSEAGYWIERLAKSGVAEALYIKGQWHLLGSAAHECVLRGYDKVHETKAMKCFLAASKAGWLDAHYELAQLWKKKGDYKKAVQYYHKGAEGNHALSVYKLAKIFLRGQLKVEKNLEKGMAYLIRAADMNNGSSAEPAFVLGCIFANEFDRIGVQSPEKADLADSSIDYKSALNYLKKSAQLGYADALYFMGHIADTGLMEQPCDAWQAFKYYMKAADKNHPGAMLDLSRMYSQGIPSLLPIQKDMAFKWCMRAASCGFDQAEYILGKYFEEGIGTPPNFSRAIEYYGKAASKGYQPASDKLNRLPLMATKDKRKQALFGSIRVESEPRVKQDDDDDSHLRYQHSSPYCAIQ